MSYNPMIHIKTKNDEDILWCEFSNSHIGLESELFDMIENLVRQELASYLKGSKWDCYPVVLEVSKASDSVKKILIPIAEKIAAQDKSLDIVRFHCERTENREDLKQEHEKWKEQLKKREQRNIAELEALKVFPSDEGFIIEAWGTL